MATHSSVLAWRIQGTGKPGRLPSMGLHRVGKDWSDLAAAAAAIGSFLVCVSLSQPRCISGQRFLGSWQDILWAAPLSSFFPFRRPVLHMCQAEKFPWPKEWGLSGCFVFYLIRLHWSCCYLVSKCQQENSCSCSVWGQSISLGFSTVCKKIKSWLMQGRQSHQILSSHLTPSVCLNYDYSFMISIFCHIIHKVPLHRCEREGYLQVSNFSLPIVVIWVVSSLSLT